MPSFCRSLILRLKRGWVDEAQARRKTKLGVMTDGEVLGDIGSRGTSVNTTVSCEQGAWGTSAQGKLNHGTCGLLRGEHLGMLSIVEVLHRHLSTAYTKALVCHWEEKSWN